MTYYTNELYHHGIKGQKWGVRRFQREDGSLTNRGIKRYSNGQRDPRKNDANEANTGKKQRRNPGYANSFVKGMGGIVVSRTLDKIGGELYEKYKYNATPNVIRAVKLCSVMRDGANVYAAVNAFKSSKEMLSTRK